MCEIEFHKFKQIKSKEMYTNAERTAFSLSKQKLEQKSVSPSNWVEQIENTHIFVLLGSASRRKKKENGFVCCHGRCYRIFLYIYDDRSVPFFFSSSFPFRINRQVSSRPLEHGSAMSEIIVVVIIVTIVSVIFSTLNSFRWAGH